MRVMLVVASLVIIIACGALIACAYPRPEPVFMPRQMGPWDPLFWPCRDYPHMHECIVYNGWVDV